MRTADAFSSLAPDASSVEIPLPPFNHHRGHTALKGKAPITRLAVTNLCGQNT